jgi:hypothetical protein
MIRGAFGPPEDQHNFCLVLQGSEDFIDLRHMRGSGSERCPAAHPSQYSQADQREEDDAGQTDERRGNHHPARPHRFDLDCGAHCHESKKAEDDKR